ncbi:PREDICTED: uncharacterized protein LOC104729683 [Camelina sativa]|uniref:Uncharacterized protein LOC104729683 n=1 Tax=Camelina sativa TaxID=90675 RepID=A0ABM0UVI6_CAMSA|nr:PREDICTED: uncharacterized protein LOC104729683 [Camelina sativa]
MMRHTQTILAKFCGRAYSTIASSPLSSSVKNGWKEQDCLVLYVLFLGGFYTHGFKNVYKRREHWHKVDRMRDEHIKRSKELYHTSKRYHKAMMQALKERKI